MEGNAKNAIENPGTGAGDNKSFTSLDEETQEFWRTSMRTMVNQSVTSVEETAKQLITVAGVLEGLYFHAITYADLRGNISPISLLIYIGPIAAWVVSLAFALLVFFPQVYKTNINSWRSSKSTFDELVKYKHQMLKASSIAFFLGGVLLFASLGVFLAGDGN